MTEQVPVISVRGEAQLEAEPEIALVAVTVTVRNKERRTVLEHLVTGNREVLDLARGYGEAIEKLESGQVSAYPYYDQKNPSERRPRYMGNARVQLTVKDFTILGELVAKLAELELVSVAGPWWSLRPDSPVRRQVRIAAAQDATRRATEYAEAFGGRLGELIEAADTGLLQGAGGADRGAGWRAASAPAGPARGLSGDAVPSLDFEPARQTVSARVEARFAMLPAG